jgi:hypothetical protein
MQIGGLCGFWFGRFKTSFDITPSALLTQNKA